VKNTVEEEIMVREEIRSKEKRRMLGRGSEKPPVSVCDRFRILVSSRRAERVPVLVLRKERAVCRRQTVVSIDVISFRNH
jgi:hypothetical protein